MENNLSTNLIIMGTQSKHTPCPGHCCRQNAFRQKDWSTCTIMLVCIIVCVHTVCITAAHYIVTLLRWTKDSQWTYSFAYGQIFSLYWEGWSTLFNIHCTLKKCPSVTNWCPSVTHFNGKIILTWINFWLVSSHIIYDLVFLR